MAEAFGSNDEARTRVFSVQIGADGNRVYGESLREAFANSREVDFTSRWSNDAPEAHARVVDRMLRLRVPSVFFADTNLDLRRTRSELGYAYKARRLLQRSHAVERYDVLHFHTQTVAMLATHLIRAVPTVITTDQSAFDIAQETAPAWRWTHALSERLERSPLRAARFVVTFSAWAARSMLACHLLPPERVRVIPPGVDIAAFGSDALQVTRIGRRRKRILFVGGNFERKGGPLLVRVFLERFGARDDVELHLVTSAENVPVHSRIIVHHGVVAHSAAWHELYANADVFAMPTNADAFGLAFIEAMAAGLPVVGTAMMAQPEIVVAGSTGFLIKPGDGQMLAEVLEVLLADEDLRKRLGGAGRARAALHFDGKKNLQKLEQTFVEAASSR